MAMVMTTLQRDSILCSLQYGPMLPLYNQSSPFDLIDAFADTASCERVIIDIVPFMFTIHY